MATQPVKETHLFKRELITMLQYKTTVFRFTYNTFSTWTQEYQSERSSEKSEPPFMTFAYCTKLFIFPY